jgi:aspartyl-tRNA(Asn)/glutamyl-tRNA(Gln) amidotransferase subunit A
VDSIRKPASLNGVIGYKPTYGSISRYGVIPYAPSMDHVGFFTRSVAEKLAPLDLVILSNDVSLLEVTN